MDDVDEERAVYLQKNLDLLISKTRNVNEILSLLVANKLLQKSDKCDVQSNLRRRNQAEIVYRWTLKNNWFDRMIDILEATDNADAADILWQFYVEKDFKVSVNSVDEIVMLLNDIPSLNSLKSCWRKIQAVLLYSMDAEKLRDLNKIHNFPIIMMRTLKLWCAEDGDDATFFNLYIVIKDFHKQAADTLFANIDTVRKAEKQCKLSVSSWESENDGEFSCCCV